MWESLYDLVIIGGGPGGLSAGIYAKRAALKTVLVESGAHGGQMTLSDSVENYPGLKHVSGSKLSRLFLEHAKSYGLEMISREVVAVEPGLDFHTVKLADGTVLNTHAVILATGGNPRKVGIPGEDDFYGRGVSYCAVCDGFLYTDRTVVVIGGGDSAAEESLYLAKLAEQVYLVHRRDELRAGRILQQRVFADCKIRVIWDTVPTGVTGDDDGVTGIDLLNRKTGEESRLRTDGIFIFVGFSPNNKLVPAGMKVSAEGYVVTDSKCETSIPGIFAIGDLREKFAKQIVIAASDGCTAALASAHYVEMKKAEAQVCGDLPATSAAR